VLVVAARLGLALHDDPLHVQSYPDYAFYHRIAAEPGDYALLEVPFGVRSGFERIGQGGEVLQYYQHIHGKPLLNAMIARVPRQRSRLSRASGVVPGGRATRRRL
jgi:hypothetical protein